MTTRSLTVASGTTVLRGSVTDLLEMAASAGLLDKTLPGEVAAIVIGAPPTPAEAMAAAPAPAPKNLKTAFTRPSGEPFFARKITFGDTETTDVQLIRDWVAGGLKVFLIGAPGCGKTAVIEAALWDWEGSHGLETLVGSSRTEVSDFVGDYDPQPDGTFKLLEGPLVRALDGGKGIYVDEIGQIDPRVLNVLFSVMDGRDVLENVVPGRPIIKAQPGFFVIASTNPNVPGTIMSEALLSRFAPPIDYTTDFSIAVKALGVPTEAAAMARDLTKAVKAGTAFWSPTMRDLLQFKRIAAVSGDRAAWQGLLTAAPVEAQPEVAEKITEATGMKITEPFEI